MDKKFEFGGDMTTAIIGPSEVDVSHMNYFDGLEYDCWELIKKYAKAFGFKVENVDGDEDNIDFYASKKIQDKIIGLFEEAGIIFKFTPEQETGEKSHEGTTFKSELKRIFDSMDCLTNKQYVGSAFYGVIDKDLRLKATFENYLNSDEKQFSLKTEIIRRDGSVVDTNSINFTDVWGYKEPTLGFYQKGLPPHLLREGNKRDWYDYKPTETDMKVLSSEISNFVSIYREQVPVEQTNTENRMRDLLVNCINYIKFDNDSAIEHLHDVCGFTNNELSELGFDYLMQSETEDDEEMDM